MNYELSLGTFEPMTLTEKHDTNGGGVLTGVVVYFIGEAAEGICRAITGKGLVETFEEAAKSIWDFVSNLF